MSDDIKTRIIVEIIIFLIEIDQNVIKIVTVIKIEKMIR